jgi:hypothetical protein
VQLRLFTLLLFVVSILFMFRPTWPPPDLACKAGKRYVVEKVILKVRSTLCNRVLQFIVIFVLCTESNILFMSRFEFKY